MVTIIKVFLVATAVVAAIGVISGICSRVSSESEDALVVAATTCKVLVEAVAGLCFFAGFISIFSPTIRRATNGKLVLWFAAVCLESIISSSYKSETI